MVSGFFFYRIASISLRSLHGTQPLEFDSELAKEAQQYAIQLIKMKRMEHSSAKNYGENLAIKEGKPGFRFTGAEASRLWYSEIKDYEFEGGDQVPCGHFSQCIWKDTKMAGFGVAATHDGCFKVAVGQYRPPGNYTGQWSEKVPRPINNKIEVPKPQSLSEQMILKLIYFA